MSGASSSKVLPQGYTFMSPELFISKRAQGILLDLLDKAETRNPDAFDMYIYNDYFPYAIHNLIESTFGTVKSKVNKKDWVEAFYAIEALTVFFEFESTWTTCDDGDLTRSTDKLYGALLLTILKGLKDTNQLTTEVFPNLESILSAAYTFGELMKTISCKSEYTTACKAIANSLFKETTAADRALYEARLREHVASLEDPDESKEVLEGVEEYLKKVKKEKVVWYMKGKIGKAEIKNTGLTKAWNDYRGKAPPVPFRGPPEWDLSKWTEKDKKAFSFDADDD
ncbi:hypothetical protein P691DRAFT_495711 [Macrolepiota fuliginosa MF-IS2]|uniref:Uncharacterized protein n=1 Tax=Macrolepiota fuliginosa MF-IS2 TaxID=1400762 RepID=A0A9P5XFR6_9AGAR|nr:hypothetical protein P691DRAFT_495711 [Macrolepiota fuliginosa MF-IS2]